MKKFVTLVLAIVLVCVASCSLAATDFQYKGSETVEFKAWSKPATSSGANWHMTWTKCNLSSTNRAVVRIYAGTGVFASAKFVYSSASTKYHPYNDGYGKGKAATYVGGKMDDRDDGEIDVKGKFYN